MNEGKLQARLFLARAQNDLAAAQSAALVVLGHRLGLYRLIAEQPLSASALAASSGISRAYVDAWLSNQSAGGNILHDSSTGNFTLSAEQKRAFVQEGSPWFLPTSFEFVLALASSVDAVERAIRDGGGLKGEAYHERTMEAMGAMSLARVEASLDAWLSDETREVLDVGDVLDAGCGSGNLALTLARRAPMARIVGIDPDARSIASARERAMQLGLAERVSFTCSDASSLGDQRFDLLFCVETLHELATPDLVLAQLHRALRPGGRAVFVEPVVGAGEAPTSFDRLASATEFLFCIPSAASRGGGAIGLFAGEPAFRAAIAKAGFGGIRRLQAESHLVLEAVA